MKGLLLRQYNYATFKNIQTQVENRKSLPPSRLRLSPDSMEAKNGHT